MARKTKEEAEKTRGQILDAALKVFSEKGYSKTTFVDIAKEIGLSKGAVYWHFQTKTDLLVAMIAYGDEALCKAQRKPIVNSIAEIRKGVREFAEFYATNEQAWGFEFFCKFQIEWSTELMAEVHEKLFQLRGDPMNKFEQQLLHLQETGVLSKEKNVRQLAQCFGAAWVGSMNLAMYGAFPRQAFVEVLLNSFDLFFAEEQ